MNKGMQRYNSASSLIFRGSHIGTVTFLIGKRNIYWVIFTEQCLSSQLCLLEQIFKHGGQRQQAVAVVPGGGLAAETLRCGCEDKFCRRPRLQGVRIFHYKRKWHRLQNLLSIQACVCVCVLSSQTETQINAPHMYFLFVVLFFLFFICFLSMLCFLWFLHVLFT